MTKKALSVLRTTVPKEKGSARGEVRETTSGWLSQYGLSAGMGRMLTEKAALEIGAVFSCVDVGSGDVATTPLRLVQKEDFGSRPLKRKEHAMWGLLGDPNEQDTAFEFKRQVAIGTFLYREAFIPFLGEPGKVDELYSVFPTQVLVNTSKEAGQVYDLMRPNLFEEHRLRKFPFRVHESQMVHIRHFPGNDGRGVSSLRTMRLIAHTRAAIDRYFAEMYRRHGFRPGFFTMEKVGSESERMTDEQFERLQNQFRTQFRRLTDDGVPMLLEGVKYEPAAMTAAETEIGSNRASVETDVFREFRMPPHKTMSFDNAKYENLETLERMYVSDTLEPHFQAIEQGLSKATLTRDERRAGIAWEFDREAAHTMDPRLREDILRARLDNGIYDIDEGRAFIGRPPLGEGNGGDVRRVPGNSAVVKDGEVKYPNKGSTDDEPIDGAL